MGCCQKKKQEQLIETKTISDSNSTNNKTNAIKLSYTDFEPLKLIGRGAGGRVLLVRYLSNNNLYAMKILSKAFIKIKKQEENTKAERDIMVKLSSPFVVNIKFAFQDESKLYIVSEFLPGGDLFYHLHNSTFQFTESAIKFYIVEIILGIEFLHNNNIIYRDLKPENILMGSDGHIKLSDFGLAKILSNDKEKAYTLCGTAQYLAPEILNKKGYEKSVDWWCLGIIFYQMLMGKMPFSIKNDKINPEVFESKLKFNDDINPLAINLITQLLATNPKKRIGYGELDAKKIKEHNYFSDVDWNKYLNKEIEPPFIPKLEGEIDLRYFDKMFTDEPIDSNRSTINSRSNRATEYNGFTYMTQSIEKDIIETAKNDEEQ